MRAAVEDGADDEGALFADDQRALFTARVDADRPVRPGDVVELAVDTRRLHFFDPQTELPITG